MRCWRERLGNSNKPVNAGARSTARPIEQRKVQNRIIGDASRSASDKDQARRLRREAESQLELLTEVNNIGESDFYSYRYFASEGFLPGYSFPRLPISAFIPARRLRQGDRDEFLSRPRFLAISEFGPRVRHLSRGLALHHQ